MENITTEILNGLVPIRRLLKETFIVDAYQRGYKWETTEVHDFLNDIHSFDPNRDGPFYCLQPIVVKCDSKEINGENRKVWELIDGQQRLTTIYMILKVIDKSNAPFNIHYGTRKESAIFLEKFEPSLTESSWEKYLDSKPKFEKVESIDNIDNHHFFNAFQAIKSFFRKPKEGPDQFELDNEKASAFRQKLLDQTKVIWYEVRPSSQDQKPEDSRSIFTRINAGKIPLTQAELLKAWCIQNAGNEKNRTYIANRWEEMERQLRVPEFRYFLAGTGSDSNSNWITVLLEDIAGASRVEERKKLFNTLTNNGVFKNGFELFSKMEQLYQSGLDWFADAEMYNLVGWLRSITENRLITIQNEYMKSHTKSDFKEGLKTMIRSSLNLINPDELEYGKNNQAIRRILLSFNILTHSGLSLKHRFPFHEYKTLSWDIEHIHALATDTPDKLETILEWLKSYTASLQKLGGQAGLENMISDFETEAKSFTSGNSTEPVPLDKLKEKFADIRAKVIEYFGGETVNSIDNLALLNADVNRSIKNSPFVDKRDRIKAHVDEGKFLPPATLRVFLKYYSDGKNNSLIWGDEDRLCYQEAMKTVFTNFEINILSKPGQK